MQNRYESQPFQVGRQIHNFSPAVRTSLALKERNDFNNLSSLPITNEHKYTSGKDRLVLTEKDSTHLNDRQSYLNAPIRKIWESDWTLLIPETHKENGNIF
jgi:hypothetical protein